MTQEEEQEAGELPAIPPSSTEMLKVGELVIGSVYLNPTQLWKLMEKMLKNKTIRKYLEVIKLKKSMGTYTG